MEYVVIAVQHDRFSLELEILSFVELLINCQNLGSFNKETAHVAKRQGGRGHWGRRP